MTDTPRQDPRHALVIRYREATDQDADAIGALHADSWRRHYRDAYLDSYLDGDVIADRIKVWKSRLASGSRHQYTVVAVQADQIVGFSHTVFDHDPTWGALLDNLHVRTELRGSRIGTQLLSRAAMGLLAYRPSATLHLWVLDQNKAAQSFYEARGGVRVETALRGPFPGGGRALGHRYHWPEPSELVV